MTAIIARELDLECAMSIHMKFKIMHEVETMQLWLRSYR